MGWFTLLTEWKGEKKYKINTTSFSDLKKMHIKGSNLIHATDYMPVNYHVLETILKRLPANALTGTFTDIGCGKGRALCVAAFHGFKKLQGIDIAKELLDDAEKNLASVKKRKPEILYELHWMDLTGFVLLPNTSCLFLFNPFDEELTRMLLQKIHYWKQNQTQPLYVIYATPLFAGLFFDTGFKMVFNYRSGKLFEGMLLVLNPGIVP